MKAETQPRRETAHAQMWQLDAHDRVRELERVCEHEHCGRLEAEARAAEMMARVEMMQARLLDAQNEIEQLRARLAAGGESPSREMDRKPFRPQASTGSARAADARPSPQQQPQQRPYSYYSVSAVAAPEHQHRTRASSPSAQPPPPLTSGDVALAFEFADTAFGCAGSRGADWRETTAMRELSAHAGKSLPATPPPHLSLYRYVAGEIVFCAVVCVVRKICQNIRANF
jgi:hypothetical protein